MIVYGGITEETAEIGVQFKNIEQFGSHVETMELKEIVYGNDELNKAKLGYRSKSLTHPKHMGTRIFLFNSSYVILRKANGKVIKQRHPDENLSMPLRKYVIKNDDAEVTFVPRNGNNPKGVHPMNEEEILSLVLSNKNL